MDETNEKYENYKRVYHAEGELARANLEGDYHRGDRIILEGNQDGSLRVRRADGGEVSERDQVEFLTSALKELTRDFPLDLLHALHGTALLDTLVAKGVLTKREFFTVELGLVLEELAELEKPEYQEEGERE